MSRKDRVNVDARRRVERTTTDARGLAWSSGNAGSTDSDVVVMIARSVGTRIGATAPHGCGCTLSALDPPRSISHRAVKRSSAAGTGLWPGRQGPRTPAINKTPLDNPVGFLFDKEKTMLYHAASYIGREP